MRRVVLNTGYILLEKSTVLAVSLGVFVLVARYMGKEALGQYAFAFGLTSFFGIVLDLGLNTLLVREIAQDGTRSPVYISHATMLKSMLSGVTLLALGMMVWISEYPRHVAAMVMLFGTALCLNGLAETFHSTFKGFQRMGYSALVVGCVQGALLLGVLYVTWRSLAVVWIAWVYVGARVFHLLFAALVYRRVFGKIRSVIRWRGCADLAKRIGWYIPASYFLLNLFNISIVWLFYLRGEGAVAEFSESEKEYGSVTKL